MVVFSAKVAYGLSASFELAVHYDKRSPLQIKEIAAAHGIPQNFLEQILLMLKRGGLVESVRGANGGYLLAKRPKDIRVSDVIGCFEGELGLCKGPLKSQVMGHYWGNVQLKFLNLFGATLQDLVVENGRVNQSYVYTI